MDFFDEMIVFSVIVIISRSIGPHFIVCVIKQIAQAEMLNVTGQRNFNLDEWFHQVRLIGLFSVVINIRSIVWQFLNRRFKTIGGLNTVGLHF